MAVHLAREVDETHQSLQAPAGDAASLKELVGRQLDLVPNGLGRLPVSCLRVPEDAQPLEGCLGFQLRLREVDPKAHDRESLDRASNVLAENDGGGVPEDNVVEVSEDIDPLDAEGTERPIQDFGKNEGCHVEAEWESPKEVKLAVEGEGQVTMKVVADGDVCVGLGNVQRRHVSRRQEDLGERGVIVEAELRGEDKRIEGRQVDYDAGGSPIRSWHRENPGLETWLMGNRVNNTFRHPVLDRKGQVREGLGEGGRA